MALKFVFQEKGGSDTFTIDNVTESRKTDTVSKRVKRNTDYKVTAIATGTHTVAKGEQRYPIELAHLEQKVEEGMPALVLLNVKKSDT